MQTRFHLDRFLLKGFFAIFAAYPVVMIGISLLNGRFFQTSPLTIGIVALITFFWIALTQGTYIAINKIHLTVTRIFLRGKTASLLDTVSIHKRPIFGGLFSEVYMKVRNKDGTFRNQGLLNKPGLTESEYKRLFEAILSINPRIEIDSDLLHK